MADITAAAEVDAQQAVRQARHRTTQLSLALLVAALAIVVGWFPLVPAIVAPFHIPWWLLAAGFVLAELGTFDLEINRESHTFTFSEVPTVLGLLFAGPGALVAGRLVGEALVLVLRDRQIFAKLIFNVSMFAADAAVAVVVFHLVGGGRGADHAVTWLAAFAAVLAAAVVSTGSVTAAMHWHGAAPEPLRLAAVGGITAVANTSIALVGALLLLTNPVAIILFGVLAVTAFVSFRIYASLYRRHENLQMLYDFTTVVSRSRSAGEVLEAMLDHARQLMRAEVAEIDLEDPEDERKAIRVATGSPGKGAPASAPAAIASIRSLLSNADPVLVVGRDDQSEHLRNLADDLGVKDFVAARVTDAERLVGIVIIGNRVGEVSTFDADDAMLFETLAHHASIALENGHLLDRLSEEVKEREHQALHDPLTGLPNRVLLYRQLKTTIDRRAKSREPMAAMLLDLDGFKEINDTLGHHNGDLLLQDMARRLERARPTDVTVARLGGDEFAVLAPSVSTRAEAIALAERLATALEQPTLLDGLNVDLSGSIGIAMWPLDGHDAGTLLKRADVAMYRAKSARSRIAVYEETSETASPRRATILRELRAAVDGGALTVHYQPQVSTTTGALKGVEALLRWEHPTLGPVQPHEFIPVAEQGGLIGPLTFAVLDRVLGDQAALAAAGVPVGASVNLTERALHDPRLVPELLRLAEAHGAAPESITFEISETTVMTDPRRTIAVLERLKTTGARIAIDEFGTGYSSLSYLNRLRLDALKVDRSFVTTMGVDSDDARLVRSIVDLGRNLGLEVIAAGVEDDLALDRLRRMGCPTVQGYHLGRPMPLTDLLRWARSAEPVSAGRSESSPTGS
ncbi:MAG: putative bifunctional diguanylate cyclase/phosphodiesterase [Acidimicrobiales bacterium]